MQKLKKDIPALQLQLDNKEKYDSRDFFISGLLIFLYLTSVFYSAWNFFLDGNMVAIIEFFHFEKGTETLMDFLTDYDLVLSLLVFVLIALFFLVLLLKLRRWYLGRVFLKYPYNFEVVEVYYTSVEMKELKPGDIIFRLLIFSILLGAFMWIISIIIQ